MPLVKVKINHQEIEVDSSFSVLQACEQAGIEIPRFCYHDRLSIAGNCRMCLVEVKPGPPKPQASCALPISANMEIFTNTPMVMEARAGVMEFLLINHPLDCPICDQGGQCDLQDQAMGYGKVRSRYREAKRAVADKDFGPLVATVMTRCIHCTRCVRFTEEVAGVPDIGLLGRGESAEISSLEKLVSSELSGNVIDLCPVGALTSKPAQFSARHWEMQKTPGLDLSDAMGANIVFGNRGDEIFSITPRLNETVNEEWLSDRARFLFDGLKYQRLDQPFMKTSGKLMPSDWRSVIDVMGNRLQKISGDEVAVVFGGETNLENMLALQKLFSAIYPDDKAKPHFECRLADEKLPANMPAQYMMNDGFDGVESCDVLLLVGVNPRWDAAVWNARIRKSYLRQTLEGNDMAIYRLGTMIDKNYDLTYPYEYLGDEVKTLYDILSGQHRLAKKLSLAKKPMLVLGNNGGKDGAGILSLANQIAAKYKMGFNYLPSNMAMVGGMILGAHLDKPLEHATEFLRERLHNGKIKLLWLVGVDDGVLFEKKWDRKNTTIIYQGSHGDRGANIADVILPAPSNWGEQAGIYINGSGLLQNNFQSISAKKNAKPEWLVALALAEILSLKLDFYDEHQLRAMVLAFMADRGLKDGSKMMAEFTPLDDDAQLSDKAKFIGRFTKPTLAGKAIENFGNNFYQSSAITRASPTMAECERVFLDGYFDKKPFKSSRAA
ncbi:MAG: NADH-quinone oxidoreductase subunit NuoG [Alphaproteobacteria bacterium]